jgi:hypothetical protein
MRYRCESACNTCDTRESIDFIDCWVPRDRYLQAKYCHYHMLHRGEDLHHSYIPFRQIQMNKVLNPPYHYEQSYLI